MRRRPSPRHRSPPDAAAISSACSMVMAVSSVPCTTSAGHVISPRRGVTSSRVSRQRAGSAISSFGRACHLATHFGFSSASSMMMVATALARSSTGPTDSHMSTMPWLAASVSGSSSAAAVSSRMSARTRSGAVSAARRREEAALAHAADHGALDAEVGHQPEAVGRRVPVGERLAVELGEPEAALVPRDDAVLLAQRGHLGHEHLVVHEEAVGEHDRRRRRHRCPRSRCSGR